MKVKIAASWYDSNVEPICIQVSEKEQAQIASLDRSVATEGKYASFPDGWGSPYQMLDWMKGPLPNQPEELGGFEIPPSLRPFMEQVLVAKETAAVTWMEGRCIVLQRDGSVKEWKDGALHNCPEAEDRFRPQPIEPPTGIARQAYGVKIAFVADCLRNYAELLRSGRVDGAGHYFPGDIDEAAEMLEAGELALIEAAMAVVTTLAQTSERAAAMDRLRQTLKENDRA